MMNGTVKWGILFFIVLLILLLIACIVGWVYLGGLGEKWVNVVDFIVKIIEVGP